MVEPPAFNREDAGSSPAWLKDWQVEALEPLVFRYFGRTIPGYLFFGFWRWRDPRPPRHLRIYGYGLR